MDEEGRYAGDCDSKLEKLEVYFQHVRDDKFVPRAVLVDLEPGTLDNIKQKGLFRPDNFIAGMFVATSISSMNCIDRR